MTRDGIAGNGDVLTPDDQLTVLERQKNFGVSLAPADYVESWAVKQLAIETVLLERCQKQEAALSQQAAQQARCGWDNERAIQAAELVEGLPRHPEMNSHKLRRTPQGCGILTGRWQALGRLLAKAGSWTDPQRSLALDLMGVSPDLRDAGLTELDLPLDEDTSEATRAQKVVERELKQLQALADSPELAELDRDDRERVLLLEQPLLTREARLVARYRAEHARRVQWLLSYLERRQQQRRKVSRLGASPVETPSAARRDGDRAFEQLHQGGLLDGISDLLPIRAVPLKDEEETASSTTDVAVVAQPQPTAVPAAALPEPPLSRKARREQERRQKHIERMQQAARKGSRYHR